MKLPGTTAGGVAPIHGGKGGSIVGGKEGNIVA